MPVRQRPQHPRGRPGGHERLAPQRPAQQLDLLGRQRRQVGQRLVLDLAVLPERAPQQVCLVLTPLARLAHIPTLHSGYVHRTTTLRHTHTLPRSNEIWCADTPNSLATTYEPKQAAFPCVTREGGLTPPLTSA